ncbi:ABC transporter substrate-binding protein [Pandoraea norimbergensis]|nr:ABC transporter substrate-binding protein [Pandoraea norimbergensis]
MHVIRLNQFVRRVTCGAMLGSAVLAVAATVPLTSMAAEVAIPVQKVDPALRARLPQGIVTAGFMTSVNEGSFPPYSVVKSAHELDGASGDLVLALGQLFGVQVRHEAVSGLSAVLSGLKTGRYQLAIGPIGDFPDREKVNDFVDWVQEFVVFGVPKGNPEKISTLESTCGKRIAVMAAGSAEKVMQNQTKLCVSQGKPAINILSYTDQPTSILAVRSNRADAFFSSQAPLTYFVQQSKGQLELSGVGQANGFHDLFQGAVVQKDSPLGPLLVDAIQKLIDNGTYAQIMQKWGLSGNMIKQAGLNLPGKLAAAGGKPTDKPGAK